MQLILHILILIGSVAFFLYGMKIMGESLQKISAQRMRYALRTMTDSPLKQVLIGLSVTAIIQSSSATTLMIVSFVNAGLITLLQSLGMIMGVNIGATTMAWLISIFGFNIDISVLAIPLIGLGFPLLFGKRSKSRAWGNIIIGFALLFMATDFMRQALAFISEDTYVIQTLNTISNLGIITHFIYLIMGVLLTISIQSSIGAIVLTIAMCNYGMIPFEMGAAMIIGENIGTTFRPSKSAAITNVGAKRTALFHGLFNTFGIVWAMLLLKYFTALISDIIVSWGLESPFTEASSTPVALALFNSLLNIISTVLLIGLRKPIISILSKLIKEGVDDEFQFQYIESGIFATGAISIIQAQQAIKIFARNTSKMFYDVEALFKERHQERFYKLFEEIEKQKHANHIEEVRLNKFITNIMKGDIGNEAKAQTQILSKLALSIELMSEQIFDMAKIVKRRRESGAWFTPNLHKNVSEMFGLIDSALLTMNSNLKNLARLKEANIEESKRIEDTINKRRLELKHMPHEQEDGIAISFISWDIFMDIINQVELLGDSIIRISRDASKGSSTAQANRKNGN